MDRISSLLAQFPGPVVLRPSRSKWLIMTAGAGLFTAGGLGVAVNSGGFSNWLGVAFFGLATVGFAFMTFFAQFEMTLDDKGFSWRVGRSSERWRWSDAGDFAVVTIAGGVMPGGSYRRQVGFNDKRQAQTLSEKLGAAASDVLTGRDRVLPDPTFSSSFGLPMEDLAKLMTLWQERAMTHHQSDRPSP